MEPEIIKKEQNHDVAIALIQKDMEYVRKSVDKIDSALAVYDRNFARRSELDAIQKGIESIHTDLKTELAKKVDHSDFDPIKKTLTRINWLVISSFIIGLLALLVRSGSN
jgi:hypothetical protein